ncbi:hypothetical protein C8R44DRAFT_859080 [Mycena epipterygia]|nr:hypothetical protein C8R44DRAFT_859080 [Mycena epipterygia]
MDDKERWRVTVSCPERQAWFGRLRCVLPGAVQGIRHGNHITTFGLGFLSTDISNAARRLEYSDTTWSPCRRARTAFLARYCTLRVEVWLCLYQRVRKATARGDSGEDTSGAGATRLKWRGASVTVEPWQNRSTTSEPTATIRTTRVDEVANGNDDADEPPKLASKIIPKTNQNLPATERKNLTEWAANNDWRYASKFVREDFISRGKVRFIGAVMSGIRALYESHFIAALTPLDIPPVPPLNASDTFYVLVDPFSLQAGVYRNIHQVNYACMAKPIDSPLGMFLPVITLALFSSDVFPLLVEFQRLTARWSKDPSDEGGEACGSTDKQMEKEIWPAFRNHHRHVLGPSIPAEHFGPQDGEKGRQTGWLPNARAPDEDAPKWVGLGARCLDKARIGNSLSSRQSEVTQPKAVTDTATETLYAPIATEARSLSQRASMIPSHQHLTLDFGRRQPSTFFCFSPVLRMLFVVLP